MFRVYKFSFKYFLLKSNISEELNSDNFESISKSKVKILRKKYDQHYFNIYVRNLLSAWYNDNFKISEHNLTRLNRLIKKYEIDLSPKEQERIFNFAAENLTKNRAFKVLHTMLDDDKEFASKKCFFLYNDVKYYKDVKRHLKLIANVDLYFLSDMLLFYDKKAEGWVELIHYKKILFIEKEKYGIRISAGPSSCVLRYDNNNIIYISLLRSIKKFDSKHHIFRHKTQ